MTSSASDQLRYANAVFFAASIALMAACQPAPQEPTLTPVPAAQSDAWSVRYLTEAGDPTLNEATASRYQWLIGSSDSGTNLILGCSGSEVGAGYALSLERSARPLDAFAGPQAISMDADVRGRSRSIFRGGLGEALFIGEGPENQGGYSANVPRGLMRAIRNGQAITLTAPETGPMTFSLRGSARAIADLNC